MGVLGIAVSCAMVSGAIVQSAGPVAKPDVVTADTRLSATDLREDIGVLRRAYTLLHPGLLRYNTPESLEANFDALDRDLAEGATLRQAYLRISEFLATIRCGHSYPNFYNQRKAVAEAIFTGQNRVPFAFRWFDGEMVVTRNFSTDATLTPGTRIVTINGSPTRDVLSRLMKIARADGGNDAKRLRILEVSCVDDWEAFDIYYPMYFPLKEPAFDLVIREESGAGRAVRVPALSSEQRLEQVKVRRQEPKASAVASTDVDVLADGGWVFAAPDGKAATLKMASWGLYNSKADWQTFLHACMDKAIARGCPDLIIDLRDNEGGMDCGDLLIERLIEKPLAKPRFERRVMYRKTPEDLNPYLDTWDDSFKDWGSAAHERAESGFTLDRGVDSGDDNMIKPSHTRYTGRVWLLVDGVNSSATFQFAWIMSRSKLATLVGEPTGGNQRGINGGAFFFLRLPKSGIEIDLPLIATHPIIDDGEIPPVDGGITPDVLVAPTPSDLAAGREPAMLKTLELIRASK
jgi:C-terminal processing protease CtpA/Prc